MFLEIMGVLYTGDAEDHVFGYIRCQHHYYVFFPFFCGALKGSCVEFVCQNFGTPHHLFIFSMLLKLQKQFGFCVWKIEFHIHSGLMMV